MAAAPMASRVTRGMVLVAALSAVFLAVASSLAARFLWQGREEQELALASDAIVAATDREADEDGLAPAQAVLEAVREGTPPGLVAAVWRGPERVASTRAAARLPTQENPLPKAWIRHTRSLPNGLTLVLATAPDPGERAFQVFGYSLALAMPACLIVAVVVARVVARRATRPLRDLQERMCTMRALEPLAATVLDDMPLEVRALEATFPRLCPPLEDRLSREREFAANASHELRTPLPRIRLNAERAMTDAGPSGRAALEAQVNEVDRLTRLVDSLLVLARDMSTGVPGGETVNLADVCRRVMARTLPELRRAEIQFPDEALVRGDEPLIEIAVENLIDNARKFAANDQPVRAELSDTADRLTLLVTTPGARI